jgi:pentatricopeptide repeat protein
MITFNLLIVGCAKNRDIERAQHWLEVMRNEGLKPNEITFTSLIGGCAMKGDIAGAQCWFGALRNEGLKANVIFHFLKDM